MAGKTRVQYTVLPIPVDRYDDVLALLDGSKELVDATDNGAAPVRRKRRTKAEMEAAKAHKAVKGVAKRKPGRPKKVAE